MRTAVDECARTAVATRDGHQHDPDGATHDGRSGPNHSTGEDPDDRDRHERDIADARRSRTLRR